MRFLKAQLRALPATIVVLLFLFITAQFLGIRLSFKSATPKSPELADVLPQLAPFNPTLEVLRRGDQVVFNLDGVQAPNSKDAVLALRFADLTAAKLAECRRICDSASARTTVVAHSLAAAAAYEAAKQQQAPGGLHDETLPAKSFDLYLYVMAVSDVKS